MTTRRRALPAPVRRWWLPAAAATVVAVSVIWGWSVQRDPNVHLGAAPFVGEWRARFGLSLVPAVALAAVVVGSGPRLARRLRFGTLTATTAVAATAFTFFLAASDGLDKMLAPVVDGTEYWANLRILPSTGEMLRKYDTVQFLLFYSVHARGHPPGFILVLKGLAALGIGQPWMVGALSFLGVAVLVAAVLATVRAVADETVARALAPFLVVAPYAVWMGISADAFYAATGAVGVFLIVVAARHEVPSIRRGAGFAGGLLLGALLFFTYGAAVFMLLPLGLAIALTVGRRRALAEVVAAAVLGAAGVFITFALAGYWWLDGLLATRKLYWMGSAQFRPAGYFAIGNLGAACIAMGPAVVVGWARLRDRRVWLVVGLAAVCIVIADASQYSKGEVERIWLLFFPWLVPAACSLDHRRRWIAVQAVLAVGLQVALVSKW